MEAMKLTTLLSQNLQRELLGSPYSAGKQDVGPSGRCSLSFIWVGFLPVWLVVSERSPCHGIFSFHQPVQSHHSWARVF